jgi:hypothetical protein
MGISLLITLFVPNSLFGAFQCALGNFAHVVDQDSQHYVCGSKNMFPYVVHL